MADRKPKARKTAPARPPLTLSTAWAAAVLGLLVVLFFHELVLEGKTFVAPDTLAPAGFVRVGEQSLYRDHVYPLWNPFVFLGMPSFASGAYNPLIYPPDWPVALVQNLARAIADLKALGVAAIGLDGDATERLEEMTWPSGLALVFGAEGKGLRQLTRKSCDGLVRIAADGPFASLNVSNAAAVALHWAASRRLGLLGTRR